MLGGSRKRPRADESERLEEYIRINDLDARCADTLRGLPAATATWVMDQEFSLSVDPSKGTASGMVIGLIKKARFQKLDVSAPTGDVSKRLEEYAAINALDERCVSSLQSLTEAQVGWIMDQEFVIDVDPAKGNASAKVVGLIKRARQEVNECWSSSLAPRTFVRSSEEFHRLSEVRQRLDPMVDTAAQLEDYISVNNLDERCASSLRSMPKAQAQWVMDQEFHVEADPEKGSVSAKVVSFIKRARQQQQLGGSDQYEAQRFLQPSPSIQTMLEQYIETNQLDERCAVSLRALDASQAKWVMDQGFVLPVHPAKGTASAMAVGLIKRVKESAPRGWSSPQSRLNEYIRHNGLDERCAATLREMSEVQLGWIMEQEFQINVDPARGSASSKVVGYIKKARQLYPGFAAPQAFEYRPGIPWQPSPEHWAQRGTAHGGLQASSNRSVWELLDKYIYQNNLDDRCAASLRSLSQEQAQWVMDQEFNIAVDPSRGSASAKVVGLINRARSGVSLATVEQTQPRHIAEQHVQVYYQPPGPLPQELRMQSFVELNALDEGCHRLLRSLPPNLLDWVMDREFHVLVDESRGTASAKVVSCIKQAKQLPPGFWATYPTEADVWNRFEAFVAVNRLDQRCADTLRRLELGQLVWLMEQEFVLQVDPTKGTASAKVIGLLKRLRW